MRRRYGVSQEQRQARASAAATTAQRVDRSLAERAWDNLRDGFARSGLGNLGRAANPGADGLLNPRDLLRVREGSPVDWVLDRTVGEDREWFGSDEQRYNPAADVGRLATGRGMRGTAAAAREDARRDRYDQRAAEDPIRNPADFSAFLVGQVIGGGVSPENWVGGGSSFAGRSLVTRLAARASEQALVAGAVDLSLQASDVGAGVEERISVAQTLGSMGLGAALGPTVDFVRSPRVQGSPAGRV